MVDHFEGSALVPPQCLCNGRNHYLEYHDFSHGMYIISIPMNTHTVNIVCIWSHCLKNRQTCMIKSCPSSIELSGALQGN